MGILQIAHTCSHLQNAAKARLGLTSIPNLKYNLFLALALHRAGFVSSVTRGGPQPPTSEEVMAGGDSEPVTHANVASRRLWLGLKYWNDRPVLSRMQVVSKPTRLVRLDVQQLGRVARGFPAGPVKGLSLGESLFVSTDRGVLEARECLERRVGGVVLCRVS
jgi:small subunit ribosomal protein S8